MKKTIYFMLFLFWISIIQLDVFAQSYSHPWSQTPTTIRWEWPNRVTWCSNSSSVPTDSQTNPGFDSETGTFTCVNHNYYSASQYNRNTSSNGITLCDWEDKAVGRNGVTNQIICRRWDDGIPTVRTSSLAYSRHNIWTNLNGTVTFWADDVAVSSTNGTVESGVATNATRYCWGSTCNLSTASSGTAANSVVVDTQQNRTIRYRTWDRNWNASVIRSAIVKIDKTDPTVDYLTQTNWWINNTSQTITFRLIDSGGSNLNRYTLQRRISTNSPAFPSASWTTWSNVSWHTNRSISWSSHNGSYNYTWNNHTAYEFRIIVSDLAWNSSVYTTSGEITKLDITVPTILDVTNNVPTNILANNAYSYEITVDNNNGAPINLVRYTQEDNTNQSNHIQNDLTSSPWRFTWNINNVDLNRLSWWYRVYSHRLRRICDEAGNCWAGSEYKYHHIYANTLSITSSITKNELNTDILADGTRKDIEVFLRDQYNNQIVPASGIGRNIDINVSANHRLYLNQYRNSGTDSALFIWNESNPVWISSSSNTSDDVIGQINDAASTTWTYTIPFYVYAPTSNIDDRVRWEWSITWITFDIDAITQVESGDRPQNIWVSGYSSTAIRAHPLYSTTMSWSLTEQWFLEWAIQDLDIYISSRGVTTSNNSLRAEFWDVDASDNNIENSRYWFTINGLAISELPLSSSTYGTQLSTSLTNYLNASTFMLQDTSVTSETFSYLASIIKHDVWTWSARKTVVYPSDVFGKDAYIWEAGENNSYQEWAKILWNTSSTGSQELTSGQFSNDVRILWELTKSTLRREITRNAYEVTKNIKDANLENGAWNVTNLRNINAWNVSGNNGKRIYGNQVLFFRWQDVTISSDTVEWNKTLLVEDGDVYISWNITGPGILGIVVLNGDILIWNTVTDIHALLYTDKSVFSTSSAIVNNTLPDKKYFDGTATGSLLANQLYIKWSIFSENTIGWSRMSPPRCPYYVQINCSNQQEAQAYDLNYLRRYYIYNADTNGDGIGDTLTPSWSQSSSAVASGNEQYPIVIEYNPAIQTSPPPFFD